MKRIADVLVLFMVSLSILSIQSSLYSFELPVIDPTNVPRYEEPWIDATPLLDGIVREFMKKHPGETPVRGRAPEVPEPRIGQETKFWTVNITNNSFYQTTATLKVIGRTHYLYLENGQNFDDEILKKISERMDQVIYPMDTGTFGSEWKPGIDNDERITLLMLDVKDGWEPGKGYVGGFYFPLNEYSSRVFPYSNEREMIYLDCYPSNPRSTGYLGIVAHEFQHMIHKNQDQKEDKWLNEGCSQLAFFICGYGHAPQILNYIPNINIEMNAWKDDVTWYGAVYLWNYYLWTKYAGSTLEEKQAFYRALVSNKEKNWTSLESTFKQFNISRPLKEVYFDWVLANIINDPSIENGRLGYEDLNMKVWPTTTVSKLPVQLQKQEIPSMGAHYIRIAPGLKWTPAYPHAFAPFKLVWDRPGTVRWGINGWQLPPEKYRPEGTTIEGNYAVTPLRGPDSEGKYTVEMPKLYGYGRVSEVNFQFVSADGTNDNKEVIPITNADFRGDFTPEKGTLKINFAGEKDKDFRVYIVTISNTGKYSVSQMPINSGQGFFEVAGFGEKIRETYVVPVMYLNTKKMTYTLKADLAGELSIEEIRAHACTLDRAAREITEFIKNNRGTDADELLPAVVDANRKAREILINLQPAGESELTEKEKFELLDGGKSEVPVPASDTEDDSHNNFGYLCRKFMENIHALSHLKIDPLFIEGQILQTYQLLQITMNLPSLPIPDGFAIVDYRVDRLKALHDKWLGGGTEKDKELLKRAIYATFGIENFYNLALVMAEDACLGIFQAGWLAMKSASVVQSVANGLADVPVAGPLARKVKHKVIQKLLGVANKVASFIAPKLPQPYGAYLPLIVMAGTNIYSAITHNSIDNSNPGATREFVVKTLGKYLLASLPEVGFVAMTQKYVDDTATRAESGIYSGTSEQASNTCQEYMKSVSNELEKIHSRTLKEYEGASIAGALAQIATYTSAIDPTVISKVVATVAGVTAGGLFVHGIYSSAREFYSMGEKMDKIVRQAFNPDDNNPPALLSTYESIGEKSVVKLQMAIKNYNMELEKLRKAVNLKAGPEDISEIIEMLLQKDEELVKALADNEATMQFSFLEDIRVADTYFTTISDIINSELLRAELYGNALAYTASPANPAPLLASIEKVSADSPRLVRSIARMLALLKRSVDETGIYVASLKNDMDGRPGSILNIEASIRVTGQEPAKNVVITIFPGAHMECVTPPFRFASLAPGSEKYLRFQLRVRDALSYPVDTTSLLQIKSDNSVSIPALFYVHIEK